VPFLKFTRDRRGYEHFQLVEPLPARRGKTRQRLLYWFRSPPNVKVGREPFDDQVMRALEAQNPGVRFDWDKLRSTPIPSAEPEYWRERRRAERAARQAQGDDETESVIAEVPAPEKIDAPGEPGELDAPGGLDAPVTASEPAAETVAQTLIRPKPEPNDTLSGPSSAMAAGDAISPGPTPGATGRRRRRRRRRGARRPELAAAGAPGSVSQTEPTDQASMELNEPPPDSSHDEPEGI
jgi:hypothetical protein